VGTGLIASLARPGGNITGGAILTGELAAKRLELLKEIISSLSRMAILWNSANPANAIAWRATQDAARAVRVTLQSHEVQSSRDFDVAFARMAEERPDALFVLDDALTIQYRKGDRGVRYSEASPKRVCSKGSRSGRGFDVLWPELF
jgi:putative ABC transport system substrate-binding protein